MFRLPIFSIFEDSKTELWMIRNTLLFVIISLTGLCIFFACSKNDFDSDEVDPTFQIIHPIPDTIVMTDTSCVFMAHFADEGGAGLSSYAIKVWNARMVHETDTFTRKSTLEGIGENEPDSAIFNRAFQAGNIFGKSDTTIFLNSGYTINSTGVNNLPILLGKHWFKVTVVDRAGNVAVDSFLIDVIKYVKPEDR